MTPCLIVGAGPYGLSLAAHLRAAGAEFRIVGTPMSPWQTAMPSGMCLKSEGFASTLFEPSGRFTLGAYCAEQDIPYKDVGLPVHVETFIKYGQAFQARFVPNLEVRTVTGIEPRDSGFRVGLQDGGTIDAGRVVADTRDALTLREASYPAVQYIPRQDVDMTSLERTDRVTYCPYKGDCAYYSIPLGGDRSVNAVWTYEAPYAAVAAIKDHVAFYPDRVDAIEEQPAA